MTGLTAHIAQPSYGVLQPLRKQLQQPVMSMQAAAAAAAAAGIEPSLTVGRSTNVSSATCTTGAWPSSEDEGYEAILRSSLGSEGEGSVLNKSLRSLALTRYLCGKNPGDPGRSPEVGDAPPWAPPWDNLPPALDVVPRSYEGHNRGGFGGPASLSYGSEFEVMDSKGGGGDRNVAAGPPLGCTDGAGKEGGDGRGEGRDRRGAGVKEGARPPTTAEGTAGADDAGLDVGPSGCSPRMLHGGRLDLRVFVADSVRLAHRTAKSTSAGQRAHAERHWSLLQHAVQCGWPALVRLLLGLHERCTDGDVSDVSLLSGWQLEQLRSTPDVLVPADAALLHLAIGSGVPAVVDAVVTAVQLYGVSGPP
ncbi:hypothetical protein VaNZ11_008247 [Volvox africanus]|uniref:Uncharacterized protein n=1 Tax=Volvox africanus TaxID=51714 RepID=A0ABQ5S4U2_9CHLO|nr:hypothetical protein VaNZ11_008247 [Volvox africanus]